MQEDAVKGNVSLKGTLDQPGIEAKLENDFTRLLNE